MSIPSDASWPRAELDPVARLRVLAAGLPHVALVERVYDAPLVDVWGIAGDLEHGVPRFEGGIRHIGVEPAGGSAPPDRLVVHARSAFGPRLRFEAELRPGWCLMRSPFSQIGMAARAEDDGRRTRFAHFEGVPGPGRLLKPILRLKIRRELERLGRLLGADTQPG